MLQETNRTLRMEAHTPHTTLSHTHTTLSHTRKSVYDLLVSYQIALSVCVCVCVGELLTFSLDGADTFLTGAIFLLCE